MIYKDNAVKDLRIAYIGGGSRGWAWTFMRDLALEPALGGTIVLYDINKEAAKANEVIGNGITKRPEAVGKWKYVVADTLAEALTGSDFVVISILPGTFDEMESDVHEPEKYGIYQSVGDTAGPGGMVRALRTIPMFENKEQYLKIGRGMVVIKEGEIVSGASSYTRYNDGIEIEVDTAEES